MKIGIKIGDWKLDQVLGFGNCDWGLGLGIEMGDWGLELGIGMEDWGLGLGLEIRIGDWYWD